jgi:hypothetical protein
MRAAPVFSLMSLLCAGSAVAACHFCVTGGMPCFRMLVCVQHQLSHLCRYSVRVRPCAVPSRRPEGRVLACMCANLTYLVVLADPVVTACHRRAQFVSCFACLCARMPVYVQLESSHSCRCSGFGHCGVPLGPAGSKPLFCLFPGSFNHLTHVVLCGFGVPTRCLQDVRRCFRMLVCAASVILFMSLLLRLGRRGVLPRRLQRVRARFPMLVCMQVISHSCPCPFLVPRLGVSSLCYSRYVSHACVWHQLSHSCRCSCGSVVAAYYLFVYRG